MTPVLGAGWLHTLEAALHGALTSADPGWIWPVCAHLRTNLPAMPYTARDRIADRIDTAVAEGGFLADDVRELVRTAWDIRTTDTRTARLLDALQPEPVPLTSGGSR